METNKPPERSSVSAAAAFFAPPPPPEPKEKGTTDKKGEKGKGKGTGGGVEKGKRTSDYLGSKRKEDMAWPEQADGDQIKKNQELRKQYLDDPTLMTDENRERAKILIDRDEKKKLKKEGRVAKKARIALQNKKKSAYENKKFGIGAQKKERSRGAGAREGSLKARLENPLVCDKCAKKFESAAKVAEHLVTTCWSAKVAKQGGSSIATTPAQALELLLRPKIE